jgi:hypothetical protein
VSKVFADGNTVNCLEAFGIFVSNGILVSRKSEPPRQDVCDPPYHLCRRVAVDPMSDRLCRTLRLNHQIGICKDMLSSVSLGDNRG